MWLKSFFSVYASRPHHPLCKGSDTWCPALHDLVLFLHSTLGLPQVTACLPWWFMNQNVVCITIFLFGRCKGHHDAVGIRTLKVVSLGSVSQSATLGISYQKRLLGFC